MDTETRILIYDKDGSLKPIKIYRDSEDRKWVEAHNKTKFVIEIKNNSYQTFLAVVSVDGLNVITAEKAELKPEGGYVLDSHNSLKIKGWRTSLNDIREFVFSNNKKETYSSKLSNDTSNNGVIGIALFAEYIKPIRTHFTSRVLYSKGASKTDPLCMFNTGTPVYNSPTITCTASDCMDYGLASFDTKPIMRSMDMGTKQGKEVQDRVIESDKEFCQNVYFTDTIYYDSRENLIAKGIIKKEDELPKPFLNKGFCPSL